MAWGSWHTRERERGRERKRERTSEFQPSLPKVLVNNTQINFMTLSCNVTVNICINLKITVIHNR